MVGATVIVVDVSVFIAVNVSVNGCLYKKDQVEGSNPESIMGLIHFHWRLSLKLFGEELTR